MIGARPQISRLRLLASAGVSGSVGAPSAAWVGCGVGVSGRGPAGAAYHIVLAARAVQLSS